MMSNGFLMNNATKVVFAIQGVAADQIVDYVFDLNGDEIKYRVMGTKVIGYQIGELRSRSQG